MSKNGTYSCGILLLIATSIMTPAFAEVEILQADSSSFFKGDQITFSGIVEKNSDGLITIVIRDHDEEFVMLTQALINPDYSFEKVVSVNDKFSKHGVYTATGFILNMTDGDATDFGVSLNGVPVNVENQKLETHNEAGFENRETGGLYKDESGNHAADGAGLTSKIASFVDGAKDPQYYVDRYYNESEYRDWFDMYYPGLTIEEAVGYEEDVEEIKSTANNIIDNQIVPEAQASSITEPTSKLQDNSNIAEITLAVAGLGILFGAVYGIKQKVDDNSKQISINRDTIRKKLIHPIIGSNPLSILQTRLAKGEITLDEYEQLKRKLC